MPNDKVDLRIIRSVNAIQDAFLELMEEKGFEATTVKDITTRAKINRGTFYTHYQDKDELMAHCQEEIMNGMYQIAKENIPNIAGKINNDSSNTTEEPPAATIFDYIDENRVIFKTLLGSKGDASFQLKLRDFLWEMLFGDDEHSMFKKEDLLAPEQYLSAYIASAHIGVIQQWLVNDNPESPKEMSQILSLITMNGPLVAAGLKVNPNK